MTNPTDPDRPTSTETTSEDNGLRALHPDDPWERDEPEQDKPDADPISVPPDRGADYYNQLIDLDTFSFAYIKNESMLQFSWQGEIHDIDEYKKALFRLYISTYRSDLSAADLRPKAFHTFADEAFSEQLKATLSKKPVEGPPGPRNPGRHGKRINEQIARRLHAAVALACEHRTTPGQRAQPKDSVLKSILPERVLKQSKCSDDDV